MFWEFRISNFQNDFFPWCTPLPRPSGQKHKGASLLTMFPRGGNISWKRVGGVWRWKKQFSWQNKISSGRMKFSAQISIFSPAAPRGDLCVFFLIFLFMLRKLIWKEKWERRKNGGRETKFNYFSTKISDFNLIPFVKHFPFLIFLCVHVTPVFSCPLGHFHVPLDLNYLPRLVDRYL